MDRLEKLCAEKGMRMTDQRRVIARVLSVAQDHPDVEELHRRAVEVDPHISIATVYRTVRLFEDAGILTRHDFMDGRSRYEEAPTEHHDHLIDVKTGTVIEFVNEEIELLQEEVARKLGFKLIGHKLELYGTPIEDVAAAPARKKSLSAMAEPDGPPRRTLHIETYGCQMNVYDSQRMAELLAPLGYAQAESSKDADMVILNTCHIRDKATMKVYSEIGRLRDMRNERGPDGREMKIIVAGCVAQAEGAEILRKAPAVDLVIGPQSYHRLPELIARAARQNGERLATDFAAEEKFDELPKMRKVDGVSAFLSIQEGCDKFCTFCVVPYTRGAEFSRSVASIIEEAENLAAQGVRELTLLGQNVNAFHGQGPDGAEWSFARLLRRLAKIEGVARLRYMTSHPLEMTDELIALHGEEPNLMPYLHLPVQSGSDRILKAMNRKHDIGVYRSIVEKLRAARPDIALSTDLIVGFPGEKPADFEDTLALVKEIGFASAFAFKYSRRPGTPAAAMPGQVAEAEMHERLLRLQDMLFAQQRTFNESQVGRVLPVLVAGHGRMAGQAHGRSPYLQSVHFDAPLEIGAVAPVRITGASMNSLSGIPA